MTIPHLKERIEYARDELAWLEAGAKEGEEPWREWQVYSPQHGEWLDATGRVSWINVVDYRRRPKMLHLIDAKGKRWEWPEPMREAPGLGCSYWLVDAYHQTVASYTWIAHSHGKSWLAAGLCQATEEGARDQLKALRAIFGGVE